jgi:hypothetical protein
MEMCFAVMRSHFLDKMTGNLTVTDYVHVAYKISA